MRRREVVVGGLAVLCCAWVAWSCVGEDPGGQSPADVDSGVADAPVTSDAQTADENPTPPVDAATGDGGCDSTMPFLTLASLGNSVNTNLDETAPRLTPDELVMCYTQADSLGLYRPSTTEAWTAFTSGSRATSGASTTGSAPPTPSAGNSSARGSMAEEA